MEEPDAVAFDICRDIACLFAFCRDVWISQTIARPGNIVMFHTPAKKSSVELGLVTSVWKGVKAPKLHSAPTPINNAVAFRALQLTAQSPDEAGAFT